MSSAPPNCHPRPKSRLLLPTSSRGFYLSFHLKKRPKFPPLHFFARGELSVRFLQRKRWISSPSNAKLEIISKMFFTSLYLRVPLLLKYQRTHTKLNFQLCWQCPSLFGGRQFSLNCCPKETFQRKVYTQLTAIIIQLDPSILKKRKKNEASFKWIAPSRPREINITKRWLKIWS